MANKKQHEIADKILKLLEKPKEWSVEEYPDGSTYKLIYKLKGISLWMRSGLWFFKVYSPVEIAFPFWKKIKLWHIAKPLFDKLSLAQRKITASKEDIVLDLLNKKQK